MRDKVNEIVVDIQVDACANGPEHAENPDIYTDQIMALFTVPTIKLPCTECGGSGRIPDPHIDMLDPPLPTTSPCTCKEGEREYRVWWEWDEKKKGMVTVRFRPLHATDLFDPDVAIAYWHICSHAKVAQKLQYDITEIQDIPNNKGRLLREVALEGREG